MTPEGKHPAVKLTEQEVAGLRWARRCNGEYRCGFLGPTVRRQGPIAMYKRLVGAGLMSCNQTAISDQGNGYWITEAGRSALRQADGEGE